MSFHTSTLHRALAVCIVSGLSLLTSVAPRADEFSERIAAASKAADEATQAAEAALAAARAAAGGKLAAQALEQAMRAAEAAKAAAAASGEALAAARAASSTSGTSTTGTSTTASSTTGTSTTGTSTTGSSTSGTSGSGGSTQAAAVSGTPVYDGHVRCEGGACRIDLWMTRGFRAFSQCQVCHGLDGNGSTIGPSLVEKLKEIDHAQFDHVVSEGKKGQIGVMPGWKENPNVMKYLEQLYGYLKARSDGVIPAGKLARYDR